MCRFMHVIPFGKHGKHFSALVVCGILTFPTEGQDSFKPGKNMNRSAKITCHRWKDAFVDQGFNRLTVM